MISSEASRFEGSVADNLADLFYAERKPPVDLDRLAKRLGVVDIAYRDDMREDGITTWAQARASITLNSDRNPRRQRFTLAHELAHVMVARGDEIQRLRQGRLTEDAEERLCDRIAASLLMPKGWMEARRLSLVALPAIRTAAGAAGVSPSALTVRARELLGLDLAFLRFRRAPTRWIVAGHAAVPRSLVGHIELGSSATDLLDNAEDKLDLVLPLQLGPTALVDVSGDVSVRDYGAQALVRGLGAHANRRGVMASLKRVSTR